MLNAAAADFWAAVASAALPRADAAATAASDSSSSSSSSSGGGNGASALPGAGVAELCALSPAGPGSSSRGAQAGDLAVRRLLLLRGLGFSAGPAECSAGAASGAGLLTSLVALLAQLNFGKGDAKAQLDFLLNAAVAERAAAESARVALLDKGLPTLGLFHSLAGALSSADAAAPEARPRVRLLCQCARALLAARLTAHTHSTQAPFGALRAIEAAALRSLIADLDAALAL
jgi:hypothetical protein